MLEFINHRSGFFIESGSNNAVDQSNTWHFEKKLGWNRILIEPQKNPFKELKKNRSKNFFLRIVHSNHFLKVILKFFMQIQATH